ncbi:hypothetical protein K466DRAFT_268910 [Polyporus arcularius HHB13444]|uniref:Uncharacterized protein n=1 Tax=Polyporus arcularius HHB13444 TaxID=1314778 RepID=A0A5C3PBM2_9APHY|nr:hypothetical protein K466DRAFT_268910 [Polyporus arcularius HHB13444]
MRRASLRPERRERTQGDMYSDYEEAITLPRYNRCLSGEYLDTIRMSVPAEHLVQISPIPVIVVTPPLPSRGSLPADMRLALDSILAGGPQSTSSDDAAHDTRNSVVWSESGATCGSGDSDESDAPPNTYPVTLGTRYRLDLDVERIRFSVGEVLSAVHACSRSAPSSGATTINSLEVDGAPSASSAIPASACGSGFVVVTEEMARLSPDDVARDTGTDSLRRVAPEGGECPPTWRHAMYISSLVWPIQRNRERRSAQRDKPLPPVKARARWCGAGFLARTLCGGRRSERGC